MRSFSNDGFKIFTFCGLPCEDANLSTDNIEDTIPSISGIGISPEGNNDGSEEEERAGVKGIAEEAFSRGRERIDEAKKKSSQYDKEETEDDPFEKSRNRSLILPQS